MLFHGRSHGVEPVHGADEIIERLAGRDVFDAKRKNRYATAYGAFHFLRNVAGGVGVGGKNQDHHFRGVDGVDDRFAIGSASDDIARRDPAAYGGGLQAGADGVRHGFIF